MSEKVIIILVSALVFVVMVLVGVIVYLFNRLMRDKDMIQTPEHSTEPSRQEEPSTLERLRAEHKKRSVFPDENITYCVNHAQDNARGLCNICQEAFCEECLKEHDGLTFCGPHFRLYLGHEWVELETIMTTPETPESAFPIYDFKRELWEKEGLPAIVATHYKINIETDTIESFVKLLVRSNEEEPLKERFERYKH